MALTLLEDAMAASTYDYIILSNKNPKDLELMVEASLTEGYSLAGGIEVSFLYVNSSGEYFLYSQALFKKL